MSCWYKLANKKTVKVKLELSCGYYRLGQDNIGYLVPPGRPKNVKQINQMPPHLM